MRSGLAEQPVTESEQAIMFPVVELPVEVVRPRVKRIPQMGPLLELSLRDVLMSSHRRHEALPDLTAPVPQRCSGWFIDR